MKMFFNVPKTLAHSAGIYKISNSIDDKVYVGRTSDFKHRFYSHKRSFYYLNDKIRIFVYRNPDAKSIDLYGFDFGKTPTYYNSDGYVTRHDYDKESEIIKAWQDKGILTIN